MRGLFLVRLLPLLLGHGLAAPRTDSSRSGESDGINISNPFTPGEEHLSILHGYLQEKDPLGENDTNMSRETAILRLFVLHDFDKNELLDGLELMQLLNGILTMGLREKPVEDSVISMVDDILEKQDENQDGLLNAQELVDTLRYKEMADSAHIVIPPPVGAPVDSDLSNTEESKKLEPQDQPEEVHHVPQTNDQIPPSAETLNSQEEPEDEVPNVEVEAVMMPGEEEDDKADDEM